MRDWEMTLIKNVGSMKVVSAGIVLILLSTGIVADDFVPGSFSPPHLIFGDEFVLEPLGPRLVEIDYLAYMSSIDHLQQTFSRGGSWPNEAITREDAMVDMQTEQARFVARKSFAYAVLDNDRAVERGCIYVYPSKKRGFDAVVRLWVTETEYENGFDEKLYEWSRNWLASDWPFSPAAVAFPGRDISWEQWESLPEKLDN